MTELGFKVRQSGSSIHVLNLIATQVTSLMTPSMYTLTKAGAEEGTWEHVACLECLQ